MTDSNRWRYSTAEFESPWLTERVLALEVVSGEVPEDAEVKHESSAQWSPVHDESTPPAKRVRTHGERSPWQRPRRIAVLVALVLVLTSCTPYSPVNFALMRYRLAVGFPGFKVAALEPRFSTGGLSLMDPGGLSGYYAELQSRDVPSLEVVVKYRIMSGDPHEATRLVKSPFSRAVSEPSQSIALQQMWVRLHPDMRVWVGGGSRTGSFAQRGIREVGGPAGGWLNPDDVYVLIGDGAIETFWLDHATGRWLHLPGVEP